MFVCLYYRDPVYFLPLSDFRPATCTSQGADKSCIEFGIQHQSNKEQYKVKTCACMHDQMILRLFFYFTLQIIIYTCKMHYRYIN